MKTTRRQDAALIARLKRRAKKGDAKAMTVLGMTYDGVLPGSAKPNYKLARHYYQLAAHLDDPRAIHFLAQQYQEGHGGPVDGKMAAMLFRRAYRLGMFSSAIHLGCIFSNHLPNIRPNKRLAKYWFKIAATEPTPRGAIAAYLLKRLTDPKPPQDVNAGIQEHHHDHHEHHERNERS